MNDLPEKYENVVQLTPGKNAFVYRATNTLLERDVFLKAYALPDSDPDSALTEPRLLQKLDHRNLVTIYDAEEMQSGRILLEMEYVNGGSLGELIDKATEEGIWPSLHEAIKFVTDVARGLSHLHTKRFVHRDIKPANIVLRRSKYSTQAVVTDLGLASRMNEAGRASGSQHSRLYRPPEAWDGRGYGQASDVYQLGIVLFQLLGGQLRYGLSRAPDTALCGYIKSGMVFDHSALLPYVGRRLRTILDACMCGEDNRIRSMSDLQVELQNAKANLHDWRYARTKSGFRLERRESSGRQHAMDVLVDGRRHEVQQARKTPGGSWRRVGGPLYIRHSDLTHSQKFQRLISQ